MAFQAMFGQVCVPPRRAIPCPLAPLMLEARQPKCIVDRHDADVGVGMEPGPLEE